MIFKDIFYDVIELNVRKQFGSKYCLVDYIYKSELLLNRLLVNNTLYSLRPM